MKCLRIVVVVSLVGTGVSAQAPQPQRAPQPPDLTAPSPQAKTPPPAQTKPAPSEATSPGQPVNVKIDITIVDQIGAREPARKTVTLVAADRSPGSIRSNANNVRAFLNVDATPQILPNGHIRVSLGLDYNPRQTEKGEPDLGPGGSALTQRVAIVLVPGKPMVLSQAADPISERKITVEVRAEILK